MRNGWRALIGVAALLGFAGLEGQLTSAQRAPSVSTTGAVGVSLSVPGRVNSVPSLAARGAFVAVAWAANAGSRTDAFVAVSRDGGQRFGAPVRANDVVGTVRAATESGPRVALGPPLAGTADPVIVLVWTGREPASTIRRTRSVDGGQTFEPSVTLEGPKAAGNRGWASVSLDERGDVRAVWLDHRNVPAAGAGQPHHHAGAASTPGAKPEDPAAAADAVARAQRSGLYYAGPGATPARELAAGVCYCCKTALATGPGGLVATAWRHVYEGNLRDMAFMTSRDGGRTFGAPQRVSADGWAIDGCPEDGPAVAVDARSTVHLAWPTVVNGAGQYKAVFYASSADGVAVSPRVQVSPRNRSVAHPQLVLTAAGAPIILWEGTAADRGIWSSTRQPDGRFAAPVRISGPVHASYPVAAFARDGLLVAWLEHEGTSATVRVSPQR